jgi:putative transposase
MLFQSRCNKRAARTCVRTLRKGCQNVPRVLITDKRSSYGAAKRELRSRVEQRQLRRRNNCAEHAHQPTRQRARTIRRFTSAGHTQRFLSAFGPIRDHCCPQRHRRKVQAYRVARACRRAAWNERTGVQLVASDVREGTNGSLLVSQSSETVQLDQQRDNALYS